MSTSAELWGAGRVGIVRMQYSGLGRYTGLGGLSGASVTWGLLYRSDHELSYFTLLFNYAMTISITKLDMSFTLWYAWLDNVPLCSYPSCPFVSIIPSYWFWIMLPPRLGYTTPNIFRTQNDKTKITMIHHLTTGCTLNVISLQEKSSGPQSNMQTNYCTYHKVYLPYKIFSTVSFSMITSNQFCKVMLCFLLKLQFSWHRKRVWKYTFTSYGVLVPGFTK